ncbi:PfkB family carbohydrate kinase [Saccharomonospora viridis]|uniref:Ribokinase n=1 Tax=Saccharomonospora viridis TaxID=1852 RepID=A0A837DB24_9PSEU|nr:PfkB family carbohydrate kinase [Saccharomonospora viridis]KHF44572.1 ribokinase [Saccharomonospora viridis]SFP25673.1 Sugar or nucleoside kinase, ribokinase family [Saccharomonospora viridis]
MRVLLAGLCTVDVVQRVPDLPEPGHKVQSTDVSVAAGGPATNAAVTVAALGAEAFLLTVLGRHPLADLVRADLTECGVTILDALPRRDEPPAVSAVTVREQDGERTVVSHNAAAVEPEALSYFDTETLAGMLPETPPDTVLVDGHHPVLARTAARWAKAHGRPVVVDAGSWKPVFRDVFGLADVVACSAQFTAPENALADVPVVVTTAGPDPVRWRGRNGSGEVAVPAVEARDTLGAGDVWHGAFVSKVGTVGIEEAIEFANAVASERVRHVGPRSWIGPVRAMMGVT